MGKNGELLVVLAVAALLVWFVPVAVHADVSKNEVEVQSFRLSVRPDADTTSVPIRDAKVNVYGIGTVTGKTTLLTTVVSDSVGKISNLKLKSDEEFDQIRFQYYFGNDERGYVIKQTDYHYNVNHTRTIPDNRVINGNWTSSFSGDNGTPSFYYYLTMLNSVYDDVYGNQVEAVEAASSYIDTSQISFKPIDLIYDTTIDQSGNSFNRNGKGDVIRSVICVNTDNITDWDLTNAVTHEWAHWNMYRATGMPGGEYSSHYTYNANPEVSYKEGWAIFQRHRYSCGLTNEFTNDTQVQNDARLFGTSTNFTVKGALYDIYDINYDDYAQLENDSFDIYQLFVGDEATLSRKNLVSEGLMYSLMVNSRATTFEGFYQYLIQNYLSGTDNQVLKAELVKAMAVNGIDENGNFMLKG
ncbi:hypothetical protein [Levilactobacillus cerevisiae]|uniref:hypothetical protein n=1 Tax=Levilactobacillus cerevisiae TaxID=1704076 RepID=UPI000F78A99F|nr:hypothetical protein [Levilactobacillus cerevisiae]